MKIYLDSSATTKPKKEVISVMMPYFTEKWYNPSSLYNDATEVKNDIENARKTVGDFINADSSEIFFTSGGSESNCWAIKGFMDYCKSVGKKPIIITTHIEHKSIMDLISNIDNPWFVNVDKDGFVNIEQLEDMLIYLSTNKDVRVLVSIQFANNEIGTIQKIKNISDIVHKYNAVFHTDAVQAFGQISIDVKNLGVDMLSASGHKIGAPKGIGILYKRNGIDISPLIYGSQMDGMRGGTENVPYIIGMAKAVELCQTNFRTKISNIVHMREYITIKLKEKLDCKVNGHEIWRLPNNINITFKQNVTGEAIIYLLDMCGIYVSAGSACNAHSIAPSHVLKSIGLSNSDAIRTIRISLPEDINRELADNFIYELERQIKLLSSTDKEDL